MASKWSLEGTNVEPKPSWRVLQTTLKNGAEEGLEKKLKHERNAMIIHWWNMETQGLQRNSIS